jgi:hypothetical protein
MQALNRDLKPLPLSLLYTPLASVMQCPRFSAQAWDLMGLAAKAVAPKSIVRTASAPDVRSIFRMTLLPRIANARKAGKRRRYHVSSERMEKTSRRPVAVLRHSVDPPIARAPTRLHYAAPQQKDIIAGRDRSRRQIGSSRAGCCRDGWPFGRQRGFVHVLGRELPHKGGRFGIMGGACKLIQACRLPPVVLSTGHRLWPPGLYAPNDAARHLVPGRRSMDLG